MSLETIIIINAYSIILLLIISVQTFRNPERKSEQYIIYEAMLYVAILMLIVDVMGRLDGNAQAYYPLFNHVGNFLLYILNSILPSLWLLYVLFQFHHQFQQIRRWIHIITLINIFNFIMVILTQFFGWYYYIDANNVYHRGSLFEISLIIALSFVFFSYYVIIKNRKRVEKSIYRALLLFVAPPLVGSFLQAVYYGNSSIVNSITVSLLIVFLNIQNKNLHSDYLTGIYNRKRLEMNLQEKVDRCKRGESFSAILMDFNDFKEINDLLGHNIGDDALITAVSLIKDCLRPNDFFARYGGDEFCIVLDIEDKNELERVVQRIDAHLEKYNKAEIKPYKIGFSMGYAVYDCNSNMSIEEFQKDIDRRMYQAKDKKLTYI
ncbi:MAG: GGDEF domain-containing protein [Clostridia bacterium]|nr:GGDEF domain-containing protein [Clostridia bacterium]